MASNSSRDFMDKSSRSSTGHIPDRIIVGIDYGTTATKISVIPVQGQGRDSLSDVEFIDTWRKASAARKVPSSIAYQSDNSSFSMRSPCWGFEIEHEMKAYSWTKLLLDDHVEPAQFDDQILRNTVSRGIVRPGQKEPVDVVADYLKHVLDYACRFMRLQVPGFGQVPVDVRFAVPATWSQKARQLSERAMTHAWGDRGPQSTLAFMSEPEAAAEVIYRQFGPQLKAGDGILICDCGGGTVDIAAYLVTDCLNFNLLKLTSVQGGKCGGTAIDSRLYDLMRQRLPYTFDSLNHLIAPRSEFMTAFEDVKQQFGLDVPRKTHRLPLEPRRLREDCTLPYYDPETKTFTLFPEDMQHLFDPVIAKITALVSSQVMAADIAYGSPVINRIFPVGGVASSPYIQKALRGCFEISGKLAVTVPRDLDPALAVATGLVLHGLRTRSRDVFDSPRHYGLRSCRSPIMVPCGDGNVQVRAEELVSWVVAKGEEIHHEETRVHTLYRLFADHETAVMTIPVYSCEEWHRPDTAQSDVVAHAGFIVANLSALDLSRFCWETTQEGTVCLLEHHVQTVFDAKRETLHFTVMALDTIIGTLSLPVRR
ncbi:actin-like ATPase domain-containing protein [Aspergillus campestris IBT 28561]|uniref:Actin-like ATPase domain-containing protein n=1 Tax=Aspergillus campestris (strain IBT 28561) TaxID=1392248 RepID=A0A2I1CQS6_ASPC2|nr:actin-like ATPase domain-containing protein [Aspergillus campestris IBT 28561]PKX99980.1 actin-like ATPase domain-containing protein [Aspergillus campestris IBT 28561]